MADAIDGRLPSAFRHMDLPYKIVKDIRRHPELEGKDLRALRSTSPLLYEVSLQRFARECFRTITILMSRPSLEAFIELSQHPYYGSFVEKVNISPIYDGLLSSTALLAGTSEDTDATDFVTTYLTTRHALRNSRNCESAEQLLGVAFKAFAHREQQLKLEFCDNESNMIGPGDLLHDEVSGLVSIWQLNWSKAIDRTIKAVTSHGCIVTDLSIRESGLKRCTSLDSLCTDDIEPQLGSLCSHLARLKICLYDDGIESVSRSVKCMVSAARNLKSLSLERLCNWDDLEPQYYPEVLSCVLSTSLETIVIGEFQISEQELLQFLGKQRGTLQNLQLLGGCLSGGSCMSLVAWIRDNLPSLLHLELWEVCGAHDDGTCCDGTKSYCVRRGDDMQACLADILNGKCEKEVKAEKINGTEEDEGDDDSEDGTEQVEEDER